MTNKGILDELTLFIEGATATNSNNLSNPSHLVQSGLYLLQNLPASKEAVFEYFSIFFDASVASYVKSHEQRDSNLAASRDSIVSEIQDALELLIIQGKHAWSPFIAMWSIKILGVLSQKYKANDNRDIATTSNYWLGSSVMRCLLALTVHCFEKLNATEEEQFIQQLLSTYMQNNPNFDWVVARLGSCFPNKIIAEIFACGLRVYVSTNGMGMDSEIAMIAYLSFVQEEQLKIILSKLVKQGLYESSATNTMATSTIPYLFTLSRKSDVALQQMTSVFLDLYDEHFVGALIDQLKFWPMNFNAKDMINIMTGVALRIRKGATKIFLIIADISAKYPWCHNLLEFILLEMSTLANENRPCAPLSDISNPSAQDALFEACNSDSLIKCQTAIRLVLLVSIQAPHIHHHIVSKLLSETNSTNNMIGIEALIRLISGVYNTSKVTRLKPGVRIALERLLIDEFKIEVDDVSLNSNVLNNLLLLARLEKQGNCIHLKDTTIATTLVDCESTLIEISKRYLNKAIDHVSLIDIDDIEMLPATDQPLPPANKKLKTADSSINRKEKYSNTYRNHIHAVMSLLDILEIGHKDQQLSLEFCIKLAELNTKYFFWSTMESDMILRIIAVDRACTMLNRICNNRKYSRAVALREIIEGALFQYSNLFGVTVDVDLDDEIQQAKTDDRLLVHMNQRQNIGQNIMRASLHAGIIGNGSKTQVKDPATPNSVFRRMLLKAILACCKQDDMQKTVDGFSSLSLLLVEIISPGVMYNGIPWPDEEFNKVTMERDLQIRRTFKNAPILWSVLALIASYRPALCSASVILRGICSTLLHQWRAKSVLHNQTIENNKELYDVTRKLIEIMAMGQLLTGPLVYLNVVIEHLEPFEMVVVLKECVWNFMKDNVPSPMQFRVMSNGRYWMDSAVKPAAQYTDPLRNIMQKKLSKLGTLYYYMFVAPELKQANKT